MIKIDLDLRTRREFVKAVKEFEKATGTSIEEGVIEMAKSTARQLAHTVQPYGTNKAVGGKFAENIGRQIDYTWMGATRGIFPSSSMAEAHAAAENHRGVVRMRKFRKSREWNNNISVGQKEDHKRKKVKNAGIAKAGWITAGELTISTMSMTKKGKVKILSGIAQWIRRHIGPKVGSSKIERRGINTSVELTNKVSYIDKLQTKSEQNKAIVVGLRNGTKRLQHILKRLKKTI